MDSMKISSQKKTDPWEAMVLLSAAICEWILIFLLFVDATISYITRRFAEYCELPIPCLFCSRIDTPSGKSKLGCYNSLLCRSHREEISSLVSCHVHGNIVDVREMCEECFLPNHDKLNSGSYVVGKSGLEIEQHKVQSLLLHRQILLASSGPRICQCCHKPWGAKPYSQRFLELTTVGFGASKANVKPPLPRVSGRSRFSGRDIFRKRRNRSSAPATPRSGNVSLSDVLSASYTYLNYTSDSESEIPIPVGKEGAFDVRGRNDMNLEHVPHNVASPLVKSQTTDDVLEKYSNHTLADVSSFLDQPMQQETHKSSRTYGLEELNWEQLHQKTNPVSSEINVIKAPSSESEDASVAVEPRPRMSSITTLADFISLKNTHLESDNTNQETLKSHDEGGMTLSQLLIKATEFSNGGVPVVEEKEVSTTSVELPSAVSSTKFEDIKSVLQQSAAKQDNSQNIGASSSQSSDANPVEDLASVAKNSSSLKLPERVSLGDVEGETSIEMLKSQIEYDRKCMEDLYKELEEERNAATIAASQAMAMITRLQEEKAALHMETLQYMRMMDEQQEYDMEALQKANDQLAEKEKELQDLEYELESYRDNVSGGSPVLEPKENSNGGSPVLVPHKENINGGSPVLIPHEENINGGSPVLVPHEENNNVESHVLIPHEENNNVESQVLVHHEEDVDGGSMVLVPYEEDVDGGSPVLVPHEEDIDGGSPVLPHKENIHGGSPVLIPHKESINGGSPVLIPHKESVNGGSPVLVPHKENINVGSSVPHKESINGGSHVHIPHKENINGGSPVIIQHKENINGGSPVPHKENINAGSPAIIQHKENINGGSPIIIQHKENINGGSPVPYKENINGGPPVIIPHKENMNGGSPVPHKENINAGSPVIIPHKENMNGGSPVHIPHKENISTTSKNTSERSVKVFPFSLQKFHKMRV